ncbi:MAG: hypothetical protein ACP5T9_03140 [Thermoplasmata archaeon]
MKMNKINNVQKWGKKLTKMEQNIHDSAFTWLKIAIIEGIKNDNMYCDILYDIDNNNVFKTPWFESGDYHEYGDNIFFIYEIDSWKPIQGIKRDKYKNYINIIDNNKILSSEELIRLYLNKEGLNRQQDFEENFEMFIKELRKYKKEWKMEMKENEE